MRLVFLKFKKNNRKKKQHILLLRYFQILCWNFLFLIKN